MTKPAFSRRGTSPPGVQRQYSGTAGRIENSQIGVFLAYASDKGRTLLDRELYLPQVWTEDRERRREAGVPEEVVFRTKPQLAQLMLERALESEVPFGWVAGDEVYGSDRNLRLWLERVDAPHGLAIKRSERLWALTEKGPCQVRADRLASQVGELDWVRCNAGDGAKGPRGQGSTIGLPWIYGPCGSPARDTGCWPAAVWPTQANWPTTSVMARREPPWSTWQGSLETGGP